MNYYILKFQIIIDEHIQPDIAFVGVVSEAEDCRPNQAKDRIMEDVKRKNPSSKVVAVLNGEPEKVSAEQYRSIKDKIIEITGPN